jgi:hypothetical protein
MMRLLALQLKAELLQLRLLLRQTHLLRVNCGW